MKYFTFDRWIDILQQLGRQGGRILTLQALSLASGLRKEAIRKALCRLEMKGYVKRLGKTLYANSLFPPTLEEVAMILGRPCYISFESGLERHGLIAQMPLVLTCASAVQSGRRETHLGEIVFHRLQPSLFFGYAPSDGILCAEPEKAVLDFAYISLKTRGGLAALDELAWERLDCNRLEAWAQHYPRSVRNSLSPWVACHQHTT
jgi:predicted transcriptional regulator of viral defense system